MKSGKRIRHSQPHPTNVRHFHFKRGSTAMPASKRQIEANRRNAAGPHQMTEPGKQAIRANAIRHGLTSRLHVVLEGEDQQFFDELRDALLADYAPATTQETLLVHQIAEHYWRLIRARNMETATLSASTQAFEIEFNMPAEGQPGSDPSHVALAYSQHDKLFARLGRYETTIERSYYRAIRELQKLQSSRIRSVSQSHASSESQVAEIPQPPITNEPAPTEIRSVSQSTRATPHPAPAKTAYTVKDMALAEISMSPEAFEEALDIFTAPPA
jgi:hypothetical protein